MGILFLLFRHMIRAQDVDTVKLSKVKGHATETTAADMGRRHQPEPVMGARGALLQARDRLYSIMLQLHGFIFAVSQVSVNHDERGGDGA